MKKLGRVLLMFILVLTMFFQDMPVSALSFGTKKEETTGETPSPSETPENNQENSGDTTDAQAQNSAEPNTDANTPADTQADTANAPVTDTTDQTQQPETPAEDQAQTEAPVQETATNTDPSANTDDEQPNTDSVNAETNSTNADNGLQAAAKMNLNGLSASNTATNEETENAEGAYVSNVVFNIESSGTAPFDGDDSDGDDSDATNARIRSYDTMKYSISTTYQVPAGGSVVGKRIHYAITVVDTSAKTDQIVFDWKSTGLNSENDVMITSNGAHSKTYTYSLPIPTSGTKSGATGAGTFERTVVFNVLGMKQGETFTATKARCWIGGNEQNNGDGTIQNPKNEDSTEAITVTTVPAYNVVLKSGGAGGGMNLYRFNTDDSKNFIDGNNGITKYRANGYPDETVKGYGVTWGVAVEMRKSDAAKGIRGIEYPDPSQPLTFDVDITDAKFGSELNNAQNTTTNFPPLLYRVRMNGNDNSDHITVNDLPGSSQEKQSDTSRYCLKSGNYTVTEEHTSAGKYLLHFIVTGYQTDPTKFPSQSLNSKTKYNPDPAKVLRGFFTSAQFTVVYPMEKPDGTKVGETGNYYFNAKVENFYAKSIEGHETSTETVPESAEDYDNEDHESAVVVSGHGHNQEIYFSSKPSAENRWQKTTGSDNDDPSSKINKGNDSDSALLGSDVYFTTTWSETNASIAYPVEGRTVAADQLVLVEGDAIEITQAATDDYTNRTTRGYYLYPMYVVADHALTFDETKSLKMTDTNVLSYYENLDDAKKHGHVVGVLLRWRGISYSLGANGCYC